MIVVLYKRAKTAIKLVVVVSQFQAVKAHSENACQRSPGKPLTLDGTRYFTGSHLCQSPTAALESK